MKGILEAVQQEEKLCDEVETVMEFTYFCDRLNVGAGGKATVTAKARCR